MSNFRTLLRPLLAALALSGVATGAAAHHSRNHFDRTHTVEMRAVVTRVGWVNPHVFFMGEVRGADGKVQEWEFEAHTINGQMRAGWTKDTVKVGDELTFLVFRHKDATRRIALVDAAVFPDGRRLRVSTDFAPN